jgi:hypothetical protein
VNANRTRRALLGALVVSTSLIGIAGAFAGPAGAVTLPDHRVYELVTRYERDGHETDLNGVQGGYGYASRDGNAFEWRALGGCCGAPSAAQETYRSYRGPDGWQTQSLTPSPNGAEEGGLLTGGNGPQPEFWTPNMDRFVFAVPKAYAPGVPHPTGQADLYRREPNGEFTLVSTGPVATGEELYGPVFGGATPDANHVAFTSAESLTANATGLQSSGPETQYLYLRDVVTGTTTLVDVDNSGNLLGIRGATLGDAGNLAGGLLPANNNGTSTNAISNDGSKVFFETPPPINGHIYIDYLNHGQSHLYMRDVAGSTTTALDEPSYSGWARYEGASEDGSLVYFTSNEGLDGAPAVPELYVFNTTGAAIGPVPSMSSVPISLGDLGVAPVPAGAVSGISAIANDGSRAWFVAGDILAANRNGVGAEAVAGRPNLYMYDQATGATTYVATLGLQDINGCQPNCGEGLPADLLGEPDLGRRAFPTPDGSALVFESTSNLTGEDGVLQTTLTEPIVAGEHTIHVESTAGMEAGQYILIGSGKAAEMEQIEAIDGPTELTVDELDERSNYGIVGEFPAGEPVVRLVRESYRFLADGSLTCLSCVGAGTIPSGSSALGIGAGGTYGPPGQNVPMNESATQIFFQSANALTPEAQPDRPGHEGESMNVYEWEGGHVYLITDGTPAGSLLDGTTPSGDDVFISTRSQLTKGENGNWINVYDARVDGGFPEPGPEQAPCVGQACRGAGRSAPPLEVPASSFGATEEGPAKGGGSFSVTPLSAAQRQQLARTGKATLKVTATSAGTLTATMRATLAGKSTRVAGAKTRLAKAGAADLDLVLTKAAREQLAAKKSLALRLEVSFSASDKKASERLTLHAPAAKGRVKHG